MQSDDKGYTCKCGRSHKYPGWVYAHWHIVVAHSCGCGRTNLIDGGVAHIEDIKVGVFQYDV